ncbi:MAG: phytoene/squalene synthase family protein [Pseudomonadota bacterium]
MRDSRPEIPADSRSDIAFCRAKIRTGSKSFFLASHLLPAEVRDAAYALYAFCREADDAIDGGADPFVGLAVFESRLASLYGEAEPDNAVDRALARVIAEYGLPKTVLEALLQGFAWDAQERSYKDLAGVYGYAVRVAGSVGIMMALLMRVRDSQMLARAADLGVAMQLTNIARDVGEDARNGRIYLPMRWLREHGVDTSRLLNKTEYSSQLGAVVTRLLNVADCLYERADCGIAKLPSKCRPGIYAARLLYSGIGHELMQRGCDSVSQRTVLPARKKLLRAAQALTQPSFKQDLFAAEPLPQVRYLIRAVDGLPVDDQAPVFAKPASDLEWMLDLFGELERRDRELHSQRRRVEVPMSESPVLREPVAS